MMGALPQSSARPFNRKLGFVYAKYFANHRHNAALPRSYFLNQLCQADRRENPKPVASKNSARSVRATSRSKCWPPVCRFEWPLGPWFRRRLAEAEAVIEPDD